MRYKLECDICDEDFASHWEFPKPQWHRKVIGEFDSFEDALWKQMELQEKFIVAMGKRHIPYIEDHTQSYTRGAHELDWRFILSYNDVASRVKRMMRLQPITRHGQYYITPITCSDF